ncbi:MAG: hypothetical protein ACRD0U_06615 [Acidimicrobiales bacterium]
MSDRRLRPSLAALLIVLTAGSMAAAQVPPLGDRLVNEVPGYTLAPTEQGQSGPMNPTEIASLASADVTGIPAGLEGYRKLFTAADGSGAVVLVLGVAGDSAGVEQVARTLAKAAEDSDARRFTLLPDQPNLLGELRAWEVSTGGIPGAVTTLLLGDDVIVSISSLGSAGGEELVRTVAASQAALTPPTRPVPLPDDSSTIDGVARGLAVLLALGVLAATIVVAKRDNVLAILFPNRRQPEDARPLP